jgi:hypothetical protein
VVDVDVGEGDGGFGEGEDFGGRKGDVGERFVEAEASPGGAVGEA